MANSKKADSSALFSDSISLFTQSATKAFNDLQIQVRAEIARAEADARAARNERDQAVKQLHESKKELQRYKEEILECKAALKEAELTIRHHIENYALLQRETNQWKDQAKNWQEHFLRVEEERCALSSRLDELVTERLIIPPITPNHASSKSTPSISHPTIPQPPTYQSAAPPPTNHNTKSSSQSSPTQPHPRSTGKLAKRKVSIPSQSELPPYSETAHTSQPTKTPTSNSVSRSNRKQAAAASSSRPKQTASSAATEVPKEPKQIFIRRVHAVVEVKQEEASDEDVSEPLPPDSPEELALTPGKLRNPRRTRKIVVDDDGDYEPDNVSPEAGSSQAGEEAEDDELMIGAGDDLSFDVDSSSAPRQASAAKTAANKKRKLNTTAGSKPKARRKT